MNLRARQLSALPFALLLLTYLAGPAAYSDGVKVYVRNREVQGRPSGGDVFLNKAELSRILSTEDLSKLQWNGDFVTVDGESSPPGPGVSLNWLAPKLGFSKRQSAGTIDWVKLPSPSANNANPSLANSERRAEYREASRRMRSILQKLRPVGPGPEQTRIEKIGRQVADASPMRDLVWNFVLVNTPTPNAACTGEGNVFVTTGLLDLGISDDELAGVMGHEIAHGVRRHVFRRSDLLRDITKLLRDFETLQTRIDQGENSLTLQTQISQYSKQRDNLQYKFDHERFYSHVDEEEADVLGLRYAVTAGYSADGLGECLKKLEQYQVAHFGTAVLSDDMSHPPTKRRLEILIRARRNAGF